MALTEVVFQGEFIMRSVRNLVLVFSLVCLAASSAQAALIINFNEVGGSVVYTVSGSINVSGLPSGVAKWNATALHPAVGLISIDTVGNFSADVYSSFDSPSSLIFGTGGLHYPASSQSGSSFALDTFGVYSWSPGNFFVPAGYSGGNLNGTATFLGASFISLGLTPGVYTSTIGGGQDSITIRVNAVPEPATLSLISVAFAAVSFHTWRRRRSALA